MCEMAVINIIAYCSLSKKYVRLFLLKSLDVSYGFSY